MHRALCVDGPAVAGASGEEDALGLADIINNCLVTSVDVLNVAQAEGLGVPIGDLDPNYFVYMQTLMELLCEPAVVASSDEEKKNTESGTTTTETASPSLSSASAGTTGVTVTPAKTRRERTMSSGEFVSTPTITTAAAAATRA